MKVVEDDFHGRADVLEHMKVVEDDFRVRVGDVRSSSVPMGLTQLHHGRCNAVADGGEIARQTGDFSVVGHLRDQWGSKIDHDTDILVPFGKALFVNAEMRNDRRPSVSLPSATQ